MLTEKELVMKNSKEAIVDMILRERLKYRQDMVNWINEKKRILRKVAELYSSMKSE